MNRTHDLRALALSLIFLLGLAVFVNRPQAVAAPPSRAPRSVVTVFNTAATANTDVLSADIRPLSAAVYRITVFVSGTAAVMNLQITDGSTTEVGQLNSGTALATGQIFTFVVGCRPDYAYGVQFESNTTVDLLLIEEISGGLF